MADDNQPPNRRLTRKQRKAARREASAQRYQQRLAGPLCLRCPSPKAPDSAYCTACGPRVLESARAAAKSRRRAFRAAGCCGECGTPKHSARKTVVPPPVPLQTPARWHTEGRKVQVQQTRTELDGRTRNRFVGRVQRGRMSRAEEDEQDMRAAQAELEAANRALAHAHSPEVRQLGPMTARATLLAALDRVNLAARFLAEILERHRYGAK